MITGTLVNYIVSVYYVVTLHGYGIVGQTNVCAELCQVMANCNASAFIKTHLSCDLGNVKGMSASVENHTCELPTKYHKMISSWIREFQATESKRNGIKQGYRLLSYGKTKVFFKYHREKKTWMEALKVCQSEGGSLLKLDTRPRRSIFRKIHTMTDTIDHSNPWIGLRRRSDKDEWFWIDGSRAPARKMKWSVPFHNPAENCATGTHAFSMTGWTDKNCKSQSVFVCEKMIMG